MPDIAIFPNGGHFGEQSDEVRYHVKSVATLLFPWPKPIAHLSARRRRGEVFFCIAQRKDKDGLSWMIRLHDDEDVQRVLQGIEKNRFVRVDWYMVDPRYVAETLPH